MRNGFLVLLVLASMTMVGCGSLIQEETIDLYGIRELELDGYNGSVHWISGAGEPRVVVQYKVGGLYASSVDQRAILAQMEVEPRQIGERLIIDAPRPNKSGVNTSVSYSVYAPVSMLREFKVQISNGSITVHDFQGLLDLETSNGRIQVESGVGEVQLSTSNGRIDLDGVTLTGSSSIWTSNGSIKGNIQITTGGTYTIRTSNGGIDLGLSQNSRVMIQANTSNGQVQWLHPLALTQVVSTKTSLSGILNQGGASLDVKTFNGDIRFRGY